MIRALILDLDNTIYPAASISEKLFSSLFDLMNKYKEQIGDEELEKAKEELSKKPFQKIAESYNFPDELKEKGTALLRELTYNGPIKAFDDYQYVKPLPFDKFLVTMGFTKMQQCKIDLLELDKDFKETIVNDPDKTDNTKKEVFEKLLKDYGYQAEDVLSIGDDPESEITSAHKLGMPSVLYDPKDEFPADAATYKIRNFEELQGIIDKINASA
jgi:putative hydrolase of the HAD superfamily